MKHSSNAPTPRSNKDYKQFISRFEQHRRSHPEQSFQERMSTFLALSQAAAKTAAGMRD
jgi:hypothetical protein